MVFYMIQPAVDGSLGSLAEFEPGFPNRKLLTFHIELEDWQGNDLVNTSPGFAATRRLADSLSRSGLTGFQLKDMYLSVSVEGTDALRRNNSQIPDLVWLDIVGEYGVADFFLNHDVPELIVSERALEFLHGFDLSGADIVTVTP